MTRRLKGVISRNKEVKRRKVSLERRGRREIIFLIY